jgi:RimJ/RimL family protein N-acetyltransferase
VPAPAATAQGAGARQAVAQVAAMIMLHSSNVRKSAYRRAFYTWRDYLGIMNDSNGNLTVSEPPAGLPEAVGTRTGTIRKLRTGEEALLREHLLRLDGESRRRRFGSPVNRFFIELYSQRALTRESVVHGFFVDNTLRGVAELRAYGDVFHGEAEAAFSIERDWQGRGVGSELLERTILTARNRGIHTIYMNCIAENRAMQAMAKKYEASLRFRADDVIGKVVNPGATPLSLLREWIADAHGVASAILDLQSRFFRAA